MKQIRLTTAVAFLLASAASATVFQPTSDRQLVDRSEAVVVATVREAVSRVRADGYVVTDYRLDVEQTLKGSATGTITVSEIGGAAGGRFTFIADSAAYTPGERVMVFLRKHTDGTYFTTSMAMGKFSFTRNARGEAVVTREVSELRDDPARMAEGFQAFVSGRATSAYTTTIDHMDLRPRSTATASDYVLSGCGTPGCFPVRVAGGESGGGLTFQSHITNAIAGVDAPSAITAAAATWTNDPNAGIVLNYSPTPPSHATHTEDGENVVYVGTSEPDDGFCDGSFACTVGLGNFTHHYPAPSGPEFISISDTDILIRPIVSASQFQAFINHEMGHAIGLRHSDQGTPFSSQAVMFSNVSQTNLQQWDLDAIDTVYGNGPVCQPPSSVSISGGGAVPAGGTATLMANVTGGNGTFTYAWFEGFPSDTSHPVGSNSPTFTTPPIPAGSKDYWVKVNNDCGNVNAVTSVFAQETTCTPPAITTQPSSQTINSGGTATLNVSALGSGPLSYQWYQANSNADHKLGRHGHADHQLGRHGHAQRLR
ncbi:MAG TPA: matrixin family metalloprotease, partial [Thermoanaerobaculia bacterium]